MDEGASGARGRLRVSSPGENCTALWPRVDCGLRRRPSRPRPEPPRGHSAAASLFNVYSEDMTVYAAPVSGWLSRVISPHSPKRSPYACRAAEAQGSPGSGRSSAVAGPARPEVANNATSGPRRLVCDKVAGAIWTPRIRYSSNIQFAFTHPLDDGWIAV